jgi:hypothetical protein
MFDKLKGISFLDDLYVSHTDVVARMNLAKRPARGYFCSLSMVLAIFIDVPNFFTVDAAKYITVLISGQPNMHDYSLMLTPEGAWLCRSYDKNITVKQMEKDMQNHLVLTCCLSRLVTGMKDDKKNK